MGGERTPKKRTEKLASVSIPWLTKMFGTKGTEKKEVVRQYVRISIQEGTEGGEMKAKNHNQNCLNSCGTVTK